MKIIKFLIAVLILNISNVNAYNYYWHYNRPFFPHYHDYIIEDPVIDYPAYDKIAQLKQEISDLRIERDLHPGRSHEIDVMIDKRIDHIHFLENHY